MEVKSFRQLEKLCEKNKLGLLCDMIYLSEKEKYKCIIRIFKHKEELLEVKTYSRSMSRARKLAATRVSDDDVFDEKGICHLTQ